MSFITFNKASVICPPLLLIFRSNNSFSRVVVPSLPLITLLANAPSWFCKLACFKESLSTAGIASVDELASFFEAYLLALR